MFLLLFFFFQAEDGIRDHCVTGVQTCALPISSAQSVRLVVTLPAGLTSFLKGTNGDLCQLTTGVANVGYDCALGTLPTGQGAAVDFIIRTPNAGLLNTTTAVSAFEHD